MTKISRSICLTLAAGVASIIGIAVGCQATDSRETKVTNDFQVIAVATREPPSSLTLESPPAQRAPPPSYIPTALPTAAPSPIQASTPREFQERIVDKRAVMEDSLFDVLMTPFANEAHRRRAALAKTDPEYTKRIDRQLNEGRINFLLFGYGETHEPPSTEKAIIGSHTVVSYDTRTRKADIISLTHDIRGPEIERELFKRGHKTVAVRIDQAYNVGGFKLMRRVLENATGLSIDFQVTFKDTVMQHLIDGVFAGVEVDVPMSFDVHPFYLDGKKYDRGHFHRGRQTLRGRQVIQFIKTVPISEGAYDKSLEHNVRKALVFDALLESLNRKYKDREFWLRGSAFITGELVTGAIVYDFDPVSLMTNNIGSTTASVQKFTSKNRTSESHLPKINKTKYIVDPAHGDGGVQWINANAAVNPTTKRDIETGVYSSMDIEVPINANPYGDLVTEYWPSVRTLVKQSLLSTEP